MKGLSDGNIYYRKRFVRTLFVRTLFVAGHGLCWKRFVRKNSVRKHFVRKRLVENVFWQETFREETFRGEAFSKDNLKLEFWFFQSIAYFDGLQLAYNFTRNPACKKTNKINFVQSSLKSRPSVTLYDNQLNSYFGSYKQLSYHL